MRKELFNIRVDAVRGVLEELGYKGSVTDRGFPSEHEDWRRGRYHIRLYSRKNRVVLVLHIDPELHGIGPIVKRGRRLEREFKRIMKILKG